MSSMESSWRGLRLVGQCWTIAMAKERLWEVKGGFALLLVFKTPPKMLDMNPLGPRGVVFLGLGARAMERGTV